MTKVIIIGGGWSGCAAAIAAKKLGAVVELIERTDLLLGLGNVGGIMRNNGRFTAAEELTAMGAGELFAVTDACATHKNVEFPGHHHASLYDVHKVEPEVRHLLEGMGITVHMLTRIIDVKKQEKKLISITSAEGEIFEADVFVDCTGTTGPMGNCMEFGNGCSMCVLRCPSFGPRVSISAKAGGEDYYGYRTDGTPGAFSGSCKLRKASLSTKIRRELDEHGVFLIPLPQKMVHKGKLSQKVCKQYALPQFAENLVLLDTGEVKMMTSFLPLAELRQIPGMEKAEYVDPYAGGKGNSIRYMAIAERDRFLRVENTENLFCGGEKSGPYIGHTEAIVTGTLAGYNAASHASGKPLFDPAQTAEPTAIGTFLSYQNSDGGMFTFAGDACFDHLVQRGLYTTDVSEIRRRIDKAGLTNRYNSFI